MAIIAYTIFGEKITIRNKTKEQALAILAKSGVKEEHIYKLEVKQ
jgi:hypothetical protein